VFFDTACYPDVVFDSPTDDRHCSSSCCATSLSVTNYDLKNGVNFGTSV
jgi:hypothetical protein